MVVGGKYEGKEEAGLHLYAPYNLTLSECSFLLDAVQCSFRQQGLNRCFLHDNLHILGNLQYYVIPADFDHASQLPSCGRYLIPLLQCFYHQFLFFCPFCLGTNQEKVKHGEYTDQRQQAHKIRTRLGWSSGLGESFTNQHGISPMAISKGMHFSMMRRELEILAHIPRICRSR